MHDSEDLQQEASPSLDDMHRAARVPKMFANMGKERTTEDAMGSICVVDRIMLAVVLRLAVVTNEYLVTG